MTKTKKGSGNIPESEGFEYEVFEEEAIQASIGSVSFAASPTPSVTTYKSVLTTKARQRQPT